jgi:hypothetical protein
MSKKIMAKARVMGDGVVVEYEDKIKPEKKKRHRLWEKLSAEVKVEVQRFLKEPIDQKSKYFWEKILKDLEKLAIPYLPNELINIKWMRAMASCMNTLCSFGLNFEELTPPKQSILVDEFITQYYELKRPSFDDNNFYITFRPAVYDEMYDTVVRGLLQNEKYDNLKTIVLRELPLMNERSLLSQAITRTMLAVLEGKGKLKLLPWPKLIVTYFSSAAQIFSIAYRCLVEYLIDIKDFTMAEIKIAEARMARKHWREDISMWLTYHEAQCHLDPDNPAADPKKMIKIIEIEVETQQQPYLCIVLLQLYERANIKIPPEKLIRLHEIAAKQLPEAARHLANLYLDNKDIYNPKKAEEWFEVTVKSHYLLAYYEYAQFLHPYPQHFDKCLGLLEKVKDTNLHANFLYIKLKLRYLQNGEVFFGKKSPPQDRITKKEAKKFYHDIMRLTKETDLPRAELQLLAGIIQEFFLGDIHLTIDHYRAAAEYGSVSAHNKSCLIYCLKILNTSITDAERQYYITSLQSLLDSMKFFFGSSLPSWAVPFNMTEFQKSMGKKIGNFGYFEHFIEADEKAEEFSLSSIIKKRDSIKNKFREIMALDHESLNANTTAELVRYAGQFACNLIVTWGPHQVNFLHTQLTTLLAVVVNKLKSSKEYFNMWSLMCILEGVSQFKIYSDDKALTEPLVYLMNTIRSKFSYFGSWKLIKLIEGAKDLCYKLPGVSKFVENIVQHSLTAWPKLFTEVHGAIRLCYLLAILDVKYHLFQKKGKIPLLQRVLEDIIAADVSLYNWSIPRVKECLFALTYFQNIKVVDLKDKASLPGTLKAILQESPPKTTCSEFQKNVVNFACQYFAFSPRDKIDCVHIEEEKIVFTKPADLGLTFSIPDPAKKGKIILVDIIVEANGTPHFWIPLTTMETKPIYNLDTLFYDFVLEKQAVNIIRIEYFKWSTFTAKQRYDYFQEQLAQFGLVFPPFEKVKPVTRDSFFSLDEESTCENLRQDIDQTGWFGETNNVKFWRQKLDNKPDQKNWREKTPPISDSSVSTTFK